MVSGIRPSKNMSVVLGIKLCWFVSFGLWKKIGLENWLSSLVWAYHVCVYVNGSLQCLVELEFYLFLFKFIV